MTHSPQVEFADCRQYTTWVEMSNQLSWPPSRDLVRLLASAHITSVVNWPHGGTRHELIIICVAHALGVAFFGRSSIPGGENNAFLGKQVLVATCRQRRDRRCDGLGRPGPGAEDRAPGLHRARN